MTQNVLTATYILVIYVSPLLGSMAEIDLKSGNSCVCAANPKDSRTPEKRKTSCSLEPLVALILYTIIFQMSEQ